MDNQGLHSIEPLINLGLSKQEALVYLSCLKLGASPASAIAKEAALKRTTVYPILKALAKKGFVSVAFKGSERYYNAQRPQKLANYYEKQLSTFTAIIPQLNQLERKHAQVLGLRYIETIDELRRFYSDVIQDYKGSQYYVIGSTGAWAGIDPDFFMHFRKERADAKIKTKILLTEDSKKVSPTDSSLLREVKFLPTKYNFKSTIDIYNDKVLIVSPELTSLAVVIEVPIMTDVFKAIFEMLWDVMKP